MQFINALLVAASALATLTTAINSVEFISQDQKNRTVHFTAQDGLKIIDSCDIPGFGTGNVTFPDGWTGNWYSVTEGAENVPGILGEITYGGFDGITFFDVSTIVNPFDGEGVKMLMPKNHHTPVSGCQTFPCANAYNKADDIATLTSEDTEFICLLGTITNARKRGSSNKFPREFNTSS